MSLHVKVQLPKSLFLNDETVEKEVLPKNTGVIGILPKYAPLLTSLDPGVL